MKPIFAAIIGLLLIATAAIGGAAYLTEEATKQAKQQAKIYA